MASLSGIYFDQYALNFLTQLILALVMFFYFLRVSSRQKLFWLVSALFITIALYSATELVLATAVWVRRYYAFHARYVIAYLLVAVVSIQGIYRFPAGPGLDFARRKARELQAVTIITLIMTIGVALRGISQWVQLKVGGSPAVNSQILDFGLALVALWTVTVMFRRIWLLAGRSTPRRFGWRHLPAGQQRSARVLYESMGLIVLGQIGSLMMALTAVGVLPAWWREIIPAILVLILIFLASILFFRAALSGTSFMVHIVGMTLLVIFLALILVGIIITRSYDEYISVRPASVPAQTIRLTPQTTGLYTATTLPFQLVGNRGEFVTAAKLNLPFDFPFAGQSWSVITLTEPGVIAFDDWSEALYTYNYQPAIMLSRPGVGENGRIYTQIMPEQVIITWQDGGQAVLYADGRFDLTYPELSGDALQRIGFQSGSGGVDFTPLDPAATYQETAVAADGLWTDYDILLHQARHQLILPLVYLVLRITVLSLLGFPLFFRAVLVKPLNALVLGVQEVRSGNLDVEVAITNNDEIGLVAAAFNEMVHAVQDLEQNLETEVERRSEALVISQRRLGALEERERLGREIHDDLGQVLGYLQLQVEAAQARLAQNEIGWAQTILKQANAVMLEAHDRVRQYILGIRTDAKERQRLDFWTALEDYMALEEERYGLVIELTAAAHLRNDLQLTPNVETQLLRIIQEGLANVYKHAGATAVQLLMSLEGEWLTLIVKDNGQGFEPAILDTRPESGHFGLRIMRERAEEVNGRLVIDSTPGKGTQLQVQVPCVLSTPSMPAAGSPYPWRVLLVDDHALFREGLGNMLRPHGVQIVGVAASGQEAEAKVSELAPDLVLMDIQMSGQDGLETTRRLKQQFPHIKVVMLTMAEEKDLLIRALQYGASGYLLKKLPAAHFLSLLTDVMAGKTIIAPSLATDALQALARQEDLIPTTPEVDAAADLLTPRQREVLTCLAQGMSNKQIGEYLFISERTVKYHISQIKKRLQLQSRYELIRYELDK